MNKWQDLTDMEVNEGSSYCFPSCCLHGFCIAGKCLADEKPQRASRGWSHTAPNSSSTPRTTKACNAGSTRNWSVNWPNGAVSR